MQTGCTVRVISDRGRGSADGVSLRCIVASVSFAGHIIGSPTRCDLFPTVGGIDDRTWVGQVQKTCLTFSQRSLEWG